MSKDFESVIAAILDVEKRFLEGEFGTGDTADEKAVAEIETLIQAAVAD